MAATDPGTLLSSLRPHRSRIAALFLTWVALFFFRSAVRDDAWETLIDSLQLLVLLLLGGGALYAVETHMRGRDRWWGRIATLAGVSAGLLLSIVWGLGWTAWAMAGIFWLGLSGLTIGWMLLTVEVPE